MYIDSVIISGVIVVILTAAVVIYASKYMISHIRKDIEKTAAENTTDKNSHTGSAQ